MTAVRSIALAVLLLAIAGAGGWFAVQRGAGPDAAAGGAWLDGFAGRLTSPGLLGARGPAALALFPGLGPWPGSGCQTSWRKTDGLGPVIVSQTLDLARQETDSCDQAQFGQLSTVLRQLDGVTPGALVEWFTERFGAPDMHRDTGLVGSITYGWDVLYGVHIRIEEPVQTGAPFLVVLTRFLGASTALPSPAEGERWLDQATALLTGTDLPAAHGKQARDLVDPSLTPDPAMGDGCPRSFSTSGAATREPIAYDKSLLLQRTEADCDTAGFEHLSLTVWVRGPVTVQAMVERLAARLGPPALERDFATDVLRYEWKTGRGTTIGVSEFFGTTSRIFSARLSMD